MKFKNIFTRGFTLIELLVVIFIIAILATLIIVNLNSSRAKARDTQRKSDLSTLRTALEVYTDTFSFYPPEDCYSCRGNGTIQPPNQAVLPCIGDPNNPFFQNASDYQTGSLWCHREYLELESWPHDPRIWDRFNDPNLGSRFYHYGYTASEDASGYVLGASLETGTDAHELWGYTVGINRPTGEIFADDQ